MHYHKTKGLNFLTAVFNPFQTRYSLWDNMQLGIPSADAAKCRLLRRLIRVYTVCLQGFPCKISADRVFFIDSPKLFFGEIYVLDIYKNRLAEAILTNTQNI